MSFEPDTNEHVYQPSLLVKLALIISLVVATFAIPYAVFMQPVSSDSGTPTPVPTSDGSGTVPSMLNFDSDSAVPSTATLSLATPYEGGWDITGQDGAVTNYNYIPLSCAITTQVVDMTFTATGKDATVELLTTYLGLPIDSTTQLTVSELSYNLTSTAQVIGVGSTLDNKYEFTYGRALTSIGKGVIVSTSCASKEATYESADTMRSQFGILLKP